MSRRNLPFGKQETHELVNALRDAANQLELLEKRFDDHEIDETISISHGYGVATGLTAIPRLIQDLRMKQDNFIIDRARKQRTGSPFTSLPSLEAPAPKKTAKRK